MTLTLLSLYNMVAIGIVVALGLLRAHSPLEIFQPLSFTPVVLFFGLNTAIGLSSLKKTSSAAKEDRLIATRPKRVPKQKVDIVSDNSKREFLKLLGATGISFFLFSLFNRRPQTPFFTNPLGPTPTAPADTEPTDGYKISEIDDSAIAFYGFTNKDGGWYIMREDSETGSIRYSKGETNFTNSWTNREGLSYDYFNNTF
jgi:hypothetical protein